VRNVKARCGMAWLAQPMVKYLIIVCIRVVMCKVETVHDPKMVI
jgi:hypothetical protein